MGKKQEPLTNENSSEVRKNLASGTPDIASGTPDIASGTPDVASGTPDASSSKPKPGTSGTWGGGWGKPVTDQTPEQHLENQ